MQTPSQQCDSKAIATQPCRAAEPARGRNRRGSLTRTCAARWGPDRRGSQTVSPPSGHREARAARSSLTSFLLLFPGPGEELHRPPGCLILGPGTAGTCPRPSQLSSVLSVPEKVVVVAAACSELSSDSVPGRGLCAFCERMGFSGPS